MFLGIVLRFGVSIGCGEGGGAWVARREGWLGRWAGLGRSSVRGLPLEMRRGWWKAESTGAFTLVCRCSGEFISPFGGV